MPEEGRCRLKDFVRNLLSNMSPSESFGTVPSQVSKEGHICIELPRKYPYGGTKVSFEAN